jgi:hypothetical protein
MKAIGCDDTNNTQDDGYTLCSDCSFADNSGGNDNTECKQFRKHNALKLRYK